MAIFNPWESGMTKKSGSNGCQWGSTQEPGKVNRNVILRPTLTTSPCHYSIHSIVHKSTLSIFAVLTSCSSQGFLRKSALWMLAYWSYTWTLHTRGVNVFVIMDIDAVWGGVINDMMSPIMDRAAPSHGNMMTGYSCKSPLQNRAGFFPQICLLWTKQTRVSEPRSLGPKPNGTDNGIPFLHLSH